MQPGSQTDTHLVELVDNRFAVPGHDDGGMARRSPGDVERVITQEGPTIQTRACKIAVAKFFRFYLNATYAERLHLQHFY